MSEKQENNKQQHAHHPYPHYYYPPASPAFYPGYPYRQFHQQPQQSYQAQQPQQQQGVAQNIPGMLPMQQSYIENILRLNRGKQVTAYMTFESREQVTFTGRVEAAGKDHIILSDPKTNRRYLLLMIYLDYVVFNEKINYEYPFSSPNSNYFANYPTR
ncbi:MAG TPA: spore coat protein GerQ [Pseudogracilibacillus sp.]|nr:spore coat protein GerQ [Pseudogracilibacillus sp.]